MDPGRSDPDRLREISRQRLNAPALCQSTRAQYLHDVTKSRWTRRIPEIDGSLYFEEVSELEAADEGQIRAMLSVDERRRCDRFRHAPSRRAYLVSRRLLRTTLSTLSEVKPGDWEFETGEHGRPFLVNPPRALKNLDFNLAHSRTLVVLAIRGDGAVGVDVEPVNRDVDHQSVARQFFHEKERRALESLAGSRRRRRFLELWVLKEAWMKADGRGISAGLSEVVFEFDGQARPRLVALPDGDRHQWRFVLHETRDHLVAVAAKMG